MKTKAILSEFIFVLFASFLAFSQDGNPQACPNTTAGTLGCELVEWSRLQEPVPLPEPDTSAVPHDPQPEQTRNSQAQSQSTQTLMGIIVREAQTFVLKVGEHAIYQLDDQTKAKDYQDKSVRVVGWLIDNRNSLHVKSIERVD